MSSAASSPFPRDPRAGRAVVAGEGVRPAAVPTVGHAGRGGTPMIAPPPGPRDVPSPSRSSPWWRRLAVGVAGLVVVLAGVVLLPLPGPGLVVILAGLALLATEFAWARRLLAAVGARARRLRGRAGARRCGGAAGPR
jgi:hypothetical protein